MSLKEVEVDLPQDIDQVPDLFIYLFASTTFGRKEKLGFIRIPAKYLLTKE